MVTLFDYVDILWKRQYSLCDLIMFYDSKHLPVYKSIKQRAMSDLYGGIFMPTSSVQAIRPIYLVCFFGLKHWRKTIFHCQMLPVCSPPTH